MARPQITISGGDLTGTKVLVGSSVKISGNKNLDSKPNENVDGPVTVQTNSYENLVYTINNIHIDTSVVNAITYADLLKIYKHKYTGANPLVLTVTYGSAGVHTLMNLKGETSGINVVLKTFNASIDPAKILDAKILDGITLTFTETE